MQSYTQAAETKLVTYTSQATDIPYQAATSSDHPFVAVGDGWLIKINSQGTALLLHNMYSKEQEQKPIPLPDDTGYHIIVLPHHRFAVVGQKTFCLFNLDHIPQFSKRSITPPIGKASHSIVFNQHYLVRITPLANAQPRAYKGEYHPYQHCLHFIAVSEEAKRDATFSIGRTDENDCESHSLMALFPGCIVTDNGRGGIIHHIKLDHMLGPTTGMPQEAKYVSQIELPQFTSTDGLYALNDMTKISNLRQLVRQKDQWLYIDLPRISKELFDQLQSSKCLGFLPDNRLLIMDEKPMDGARRVGLFNPALLDIAPLFSLRSIPENEFETALISPEGHIILLSEKNIFIFHANEKSDLTPVWNELNISSLRTMPRGVKTLIAEYATACPSLFFKRAEQQGFQAPQRLSAASQQQIKTYIDNLTYAPSKSSQKEEIDNIQKAWRFFLQYLEDHSEESVATCYTKVRSEYPELFKNIFSFWRTNEVEAFFHQICAQENPTLKKC